MPRTAPLGTARDALGVYALQLGVLALVSLCVACTTVVLMQNEAHTCVSLCRPRMLLLSLALTLTVSAVVCVMCVGLRAGAHYGVRVHAAASPAQLLLLTSRLTRRENALVGRAATSTLLGVLCFTGVGLMQTAWWLETGLLVVLLGISVRRSVVFFNSDMDDDNDTAPVKQELQGALTRARSVAARDYATIAANMVRRRYGYGKEGSTIINPYKA